jgi:hypothetical protein
MKKLFLLSSALLLTLTTHAQIARDFMISGGIDLVKSDYDGFFEKIQSGMEVNYFISRKFTFTAGAEWWTENDEISLVVGGRWFPIHEAFFRLRGLIGANDVSIGGGWTKPLNENWKFEAMGDIYAKGDIAIRAGITYVIRRKATP